MHKQQTNLWIKLRRARVSGQDRKKPLPEPIRLQDLEDSARSQAQKKIKYLSLMYFCILLLYFWLMAKIYEWMNKCSLCLQGFLLDIFLLYSEMEASRLS